MSPVGSAIARHMSVCPITIRADQPLAAAHEVMRSLGIRHLPVVCDGHLVGVVSQRDLYFLESLGGVDTARVTIEEAMSDPPFVVDPDASVRRVVQEMARHRYGCAVVADRGEVLGVFTTTDAMRLLAHELERRSTARPAGRPRTRRAS